MKTLKTEGVEAYTKEIVSIEYGYYGESFFDGCYFKVTKGSNIISEENISKGRLNELLYKYSIEDTGV